VHPIDRIIALAFRRGPASQKIFGSGWGDEQLVEAIRVTDDDVTPPSPIAVDWGRTDRLRGLSITDGVFHSPEDRLPVKAHTAHVRLVAPSRSAGRLVVMMSAWNDQGYRTRERLARPLAERGITSVMLENPFHGARRVVDGPPIRTVADFALMGRAAVDEGRALLAHFAVDFQVGVTGYSMGGNIAALVGALMDRPVAIAALAASHSPGPVWLDGILHDMIDWTALGGPAEAGRLRNTLALASVLSVPARPHTSEAVIVASRSDGYIPVEAVEALHAHWPGSELRWLSGGHATMIFTQRTQLVEAIVASFDRAFGRAS